MPDGGLRRCCIPAAARSKIGLALKRQGNRASTDPVRSDHIQPMLERTLRPHTSHKSMRAAQFPLPPWGVALAGAAPVALCAAILALPDLGHARSILFRGLYGVAVLAWIVPLIWLQRRAWMAQWHWAVHLLVVLGLTYLMAMVNNAAGQGMSMLLGTRAQFSWSDLPLGLDSCWLALIAYSAMHAGIAYFLALQSAQERLAMAQLEARSAQLLALRYQINPHFLFNSLNAVSSLVTESRQREAVRMLAQLAEFLRATLDAGQIMEHAVADELALTQSYLAVEQQRLGDRLVLDVRVGPGALDARIPYLLLQPLVENAIRHGIARRNESGQLSVVINVQADRLVLDVINDMPHSADTVASPSAAGAAERGGIGLENLARRLQSLYGDRHLIKIDRAAVDSFGVHVELPLLRMAPVTAIRDAA